MIEIDTQTPIFHQLWFEQRPPYPVGTDFCLAEEGKHEKNGKTLCPRCW